MKLTIISCVIGVFSIGTATMASEYSCQILRNDGSLISQKTVSLKKGQEKKLFENEEALIYLRQMPMGELQNASFLGFYSKDRNLPPGWYHSGVFASVGSKTLLQKDDYGISAQCQEL